MANRSVIMGMRMPLKNNKEIIDDTDQVEELPEDVTPSLTQPPDYDQLFSDYETELQNIQEQRKDLETETAQEEENVGLQSGVAGALQSFGEGLAAITGGSAKPLQTAAANVKAMGAERIASQQRKTKSLRERMELAREPLERRATQEKFRDVFEKRQLQTRLGDPQSKESVEARGMAQSFFDVLSANLQSKGAPDVAARVSGLKDQIGQMNANQVKQLMDNLKSMKFETGFEQKTAAQQAQAASKLEGQKELIGLKLEGQKELTGYKQELAQDLAKMRNQMGEEKTALTMYKDTSEKMQKDLNDARQAQTLWEQQTSFMKDLDDALAGDKAAKDRVIQDKGIVAYLNARTRESKGVFTDQDFNVLDNFRAGRTWMQTLSDWVGEGLTGEVSQERLQKFKDIMQRTVKSAPNAESGIKKAYADRFKNMYDVTKIERFKEFSDKLANEGGQVSPVKEKKAGQKAAPIDILTKRNWEQSNIQEGDEFIIDTGKVKKLYKREGNNATFIRNL